MRMKIRRQILHSESEEDWVPSDNDDYFDVNWDSIEDTDYLNLKKDPEVSNFVLVKLLNEDKRISEFFVAKDLEKKSPDEWKVCFQRKGSKVPNAFIFPNIAEISVVARAYLKMVLPPPLDIGTTKRQKKMQFEVNLCSLYLG
ncbi:hypothetical protein AVEN_127987-1 [Araneus ventricosus]|uniref:Uncharacterized protein n=1 Tax=Araneus ventricosus TaxID=182803 RepID=A0A4Y2A016_ARAVE|nr:hypothetical protein AVEN_127987-1 [Araneus ventricosus]